VAAGVCLKVAEYSLGLRFLGPGSQLANLDVTLRGGFGHALREVSCAQPGGVCAECVLGDRCAYGYLFDTAVPAHAEVMRRYTHAPHPFVLRSLKSDLPSTSRDTVADLSLLLFGRASQYFPYAVFALQRLGANGLGPRRLPFEVTLIRQRSGEVIYRQGERRALSAAAPEVLVAEVGPPRPGRFRLHFRSPTRLRVNNQVLRKPAFAPFVSAALRRLELLCRMHDAGTFEINAVELAQQAEAVQLVRDATRWQELSRYSRRQEQSMPLGGLRGWAEFAGDLGTFGPLVKLAGAVHVGRNTAFGNGLCELEELTDGGTP
jgi:hypothetical protein